MNKYLRDGKVAVLYSPGFGAGWYSWNKDFPQCVFDPIMVQWVLDGKVGALPESWLEYAKEDNFYPGGAKDLQVEWLQPNTQFRIDEYDGSECIIEMLPQNYITA